RRTPLGPHRGCARGCAGGRCGRPGANSRSRSPGSSLKPIECQGIAETPLRLHPARDKETPLRFRFDWSIIMELGIYSFAERISDPHTRHLLTPEERVKEVLEEIELADQVGLDLYGLGEHHREDFVASSPAIVLAAAAARTKRIRLSSAVTVISSSDPVRVFEDFSTLDLVSGGRAEIMVGRGSFVESFPLYGFSLADYDELFNEKLGLLQQLNREERVTWSGTHRPPLSDQPVYPRPGQDELPVWIGVGGAPASAHRAGRLGLPIALGIIGGDVRRFAPLLDLYKEEYLRAGHAPARMRISVYAH